MSHLISKNRSQETYPLAPTTNGPTDEVRHFSSSGIGVLSGGNVQYLADDAVLVSAAVLPIGTPLRYPALGAYTRALLKIFVSVNQQNTPGSHMTVAVAVNGVAVPATDIIVPAGATGLFPAVPAVVPIVVNPNDGVDVQVTFTSQEGAHQVTLAGSLQLLP